MRTRRARDGFQATIDPDAAPLSRGRLRVLRIAILVLFTVLTVGISVLHGTRIVALIEDRSLTEARSYADLVIAARSWNARHGGVWVEKTPSADTNPYLLGLGIQADRMVDDGTTLTLRNPSLMTREIAEEMGRTGAPSAFKLTSLLPVNPANAPDMWERDQLERFEARGSDVTEAWSTDSAAGDGERFRYMRVLFVDASCLQCHAGAGYEVGDVRGALSVSLPYAETAASLARTRDQVFGIAAVVLLLTWTGVIVATRLQERQVAASEHALATAAATDPLTRLSNRGHTFERLRTEIGRTRRTRTGLGVMLADIDDFKRINDTYGHAAGDDVLRTVAVTVKNAVRTYDLVGRIGGEELLVVAPDIEPEALSELAERVRAAVQGAYALDGSRERVSVSIGTAYLPHGSGESLDALVARADEAMYRAKRSGKNCVESC